MTTVSSVLAQVQAEATTNLNTANTVFTALKADTPSNLPGGLEGQVIGGQILFQQYINAVLTSFPSSLSATNDANAVVIATLQNLLLNQQNVNNILNEIETNDTYEQPISLTILNILLLLGDGIILTELAGTAVAYALFAQQALTGNLVTVNTPGAYTVNVPSGAKFVDLVLIGGGGGGGGYDTPGAGTGGNGGNTTATPAGGSTLTAAGGTGGASTTGTANSAGFSPGTKAWDGQNYTGGTGGVVGSNGAGGNGTAPGAGGGGGGAFGSYGGVGGAAGAWAAETIAVTSGMTTITGTVGAGGTAGATSIAPATGGTGGHGEAFFYFYS